jgi:acetoacetate decarboxylase
VAFPKVKLVDYDSIRIYQSWEPACIQSLKMEPSLDDPWAEMEVVKLLGAGYSVNSTGWRASRPSPSSKR